MKNSFCARFRELLQGSNISKRAFAQKIGVSAASISDWSNGKVQPTAENIYMVAEFFEVSTDYLLGLEDDFGNVAVQSSASGRTASQLSEEEQKLIEDYRGLGQPLKDLIKNMIQSWQGENTREKVGKK